MDSQHQQKTQGSSRTSSSASAELSDLTDWLTDLMAAVKVTNPIARRDPDRAIQVMAEACLKFPLDLILTTVEGIKADPDAVWPSAGTMIGLLYDKQRLRAEAKASQPVPVARRVEHKPIPVHRQMAALLRSPGGQYALRNGYGPQLIRDARAGKVDALGADQDWYKRPKLAGNAEMVALVHELEAGTCSLAPDVKGTFKIAIASLGRARITANDRLKEIYLDRQSDML